jgi:glyoxylase-like metal-dependent hydrolase (beta-lactamase superfamily II)
LAIDREPLPGRADAVSSKPSWLRQIKRESENLNVEKIRDDLFRLSAPSFMWPATAAVYVVTDSNGFSMIDVGCGSPGAIERLKSGLSRLGLGLSSLGTLILSHAHPDHMGASQMLLSECRPTVLIHTDDVDHARNPQGLIDTFDIELVKRLYGRVEGPVGDLFSFFDGSG